MRRVILAIAVVFLVIVAGAWLFLNLRAKQNYVCLRDEVMQNSFSVKPMDEGTKNLLVEIREKWEEVYSEVDGAQSKGLEALELRASIENLVEVCGYQLPEYSFVSPSQNRRATLLGLFQLFSLGPSTDKSLHVSGDGHFAVMRCGTNCAFVFSDEDGGLRETLYRPKARNIEPENNAAEKSQSGSIGR